MNIELNKFELLYLLDGCAGKSHLRQGIWHKMINLYNNMSARYREFLYTYSRRDLAVRYDDRVMSNGEIFPQVGKEDFMQFLCAFNPNNRYIIKTNDNKTFMAYQFCEEYYTESNRFLPGDVIKEIIKDDTFDKCNNLSCPLKDKCARFLENTNDIGFSYQGGCDWFIDKNNNSGYEPNLNH